MAGIKERNFLKKHALFGGSMEDTQLICGAINPVSPTGYAKAEELYEQIRKRRKDYINVARNSGCSLEQAKVIKDYIFNNMHELRRGYRRFDADLMIAQSWLRLSERNANNIQKHDLTLLYHELYEIRLLLSDNNLHQAAAHEQAQEKYNYNLEARQFYARHGFIV